MSTEVINVPPELRRSGFQSRVSGIGVLLLALGALAWGGVTTVRAFTDSWVAPIFLSPDNDAVLQLKLNLNRQVAELDQAAAEIKRIDGDVEAVSAAIARLTSLRGHTRQSLHWKASTQDDEVRAVSMTLDHLRSQRTILERLLERQGALTTKAREDLKAGLIDRTTADKDEQALDTLKVSLVTNQKELDEATWRQGQSAQDSTAYQNALGRPSGRGSLKPEVAEGEEHQARLELELIKLEAERRGLQGIRRAASESLSRQRELLEELHTRPLYRAMTHGTEVAFVPYTQLAGVQRGSSVLRCLGGLVRCQQVGVVAEVLPGEVATQDPWGNVARGQYAVLDLDDRDAIREKVLRIRRM